MTIFRYIQLGAFVAVAAAIAWLMWQNHSKSQKIEMLQLERDTAQEDLATAEEVNKANLELLESQLEGERVARRIAEEALIRSQSRDREVRDLINGLRSTPQEDRLPVSPTVCGTIDRLYPLETRAACPD